MAWTKVSGDGSHDKVTTSNGQTTITQTVNPQTKGNPGSMISSKTEVGGSVAHRTTLHPDSPPHYHDGTETHPRNK